MFFFLHAMFQHLPGWSSPNLTACGRCHWQNKQRSHPAPHVTPLLLSLTYLAGLRYNNSFWNDLDSLQYPSARMDWRQCKQQPLEDTDKVNKGRRRSKWYFYKFFAPHISTNWILWFKEPFQNVRVKLLKSVVEYVYPHAPPGCLCATVS